MKNLLCLLKTKGHSSLLVFICLLLIGCNNRDQTGEFYTHWDIAGGCATNTDNATRLSASGDQIDVCDDTALYDWIWVTYAAPWCNASTQQAPHIRQLTDTATTQLKVYTVMTGSDQPFVDATIDDARRWSNRYHLPQNRVLIEEGSRVIPQHLIIGPDGKTWYRYIGHMTTEEMQNLLADFQEGRKYPNVRSLPRR
ncbi:MAG: hypothetical protein LRY63_03840 [Nitrincola sp.]|nr:hypothetical protein [Nitrincola sp.]